MYYPKSQIKTNLYTNGDQYILSTTKESYIGPYYEISNGKKYTGAFPNSSPNVLLIEPVNALDPVKSTPTDPIIYNLDSSIYKEGKDPSTTLDPNVYFDLTNQNNIPQFRLIPQFNPTLPTDQDKQNGLFTRYFCAKTNELRYFEIDKLTYDKLNTRDKQIAWDLYIAASVVWRIKGEKEQVYKSNKGAIISLEQNLRWGGFSQYFQDKFLQYYLES